MSGNAPGAEPHADNTPKPKLTRDQEVAQIRERLFRHVSGEPA